MSITRSFTIADVEPEELAALFCNMDAGEQARFFSRVGVIASAWPGAGWCQQCCAISEHLDKSATETIAKLAEWAADPYVSPAASLHFPGADGSTLAAIEARDGKECVPHAALPSGGVGNV